MAYGVVGNGTTGYANLLSTATLTGVFEVEATFKYDSSATNQCLWSGGSATRIRINSSTQCLVRVGGTSRTRTLVTPLVDGTVYTWKLVRDGSDAVDLVDEFDVSVITTAFGTKTGNVSATRLMASITPAEFFAGELHTFLISDAGVPLLELVNTTGTGSVWTDVIGTSNGNLIGLPTNGDQWVELGGGGVTVTVNETGPSFSESINTNLSVNITGNITESGPAFNESISATLSTLTIQSNITESGPSFTEEISSTVNPSLIINANITEQGSSFAESINADLGIRLSAAITELGPSFIESINVSTTTEINASITEFGPSFTENINVTVPIKITVNPKNLIRVKRKSNTVRIKRTSSAVRVKRKSNTVRVK